MAGKQTAVAAIPEQMSHANLMELLGQTGSVASEGEAFHRMSLEAGTIVIDKGTDNEETFYPQKNGPVLTVRIVEPPEYYYAIFMSDTETNGAINAQRIGRADLNGGFSRKYDDPATQQERMNARNEIFDDIRAQMVNVIDVRSGRPIKPAFKADMKVQIVPEDGNLTGEETTYTLTLAATSVFEWRGTSRARDAGFVSDTNFMVKLGQLAVQQAAENGADENDQTRAVIDALTSLRMGGVIADLYILKAQNQEKTNSWNIVSFTPVHIEPPVEAPALGAGESSDPNDDQLGF